MRSTKFLLSLSTFISIFSPSSLVLGAAVANTNVVVNVTAPAEVDSSALSIGDRLRLNMASLGTDEDDGIDPEPLVYGKTHLILNNPNITNSNCMAYLSNPNATHALDPTHPESECSLIHLADSLDQAYTRLAELESSRDEIIGILYCKTNRRSPYAYDTRRASAILEQRGVDMCYSWEKRRLCSTSQSYGSSNVQYCRPAHVEEGNGFDCGLNGRWSYWISAQCLSHSYPPRAGGIAAVDKPWPYGAIRVAHSGRRSEVDD